MGGTRVSTPPGIELRQVRVNVYEEEEEEEEEGDEPRYNLRK